MSFLGLMTVRAHEARVRHLTYLFETRGEIISDRDATIGRLQRENSGLLRDKLNESARANLAEKRVRSLLDEVDALTPDAQKWRDRKKADREYRAEKRAQVNV